MQRMQKQHYWVWLPRREFSQIPFELGQNKKPTRNQNVFTPPERAGQFNQESSFLGDFALHQQIN